MNILFTLPQRRQDNIHYTEPEVEVFPKLVRAHFFLKVGICCRDDTDIHLDGLVLAHRVKCSFLEKAQQPQLHARRNITYLVEKKGAAVSLQDSSKSVTVSTGKRAFLMAEEFTLKEFFRNGRAVNLDQGAVVAGAFFVQGICNQLLPCPALACYKDCSIHLADAFDKGIYTLHRLTFSHKTMKI